MTGYTKLFSDIILSTIWREANEVKVLWITMLALKDRHHVVDASIPGLAHSAGITIKECETSIEILSLPDPYSRSPEFEGRRIEPCPGGWLILNGEKYRGKLSKEDRKEQQRIWQQEYRDREKAKVEEARKQNVNAGKRNVNAVNELTMSTHSEAEANLNKEEEDIYTRFEVVWNLYGHKKSRLDARRAWDRLPIKDKEAVIKHIPGFVRATPDKTHRPYLSTYLNKQRWKDEELPEQEDKKRATAHERTARNFGAVSVDDALREAGYDIGNEPVPEDDSEIIITYEPPDG